MSEDNIRGVGVSEAQQIESQLRNLVSREPDPGRLVRITSVLADLIRSQALLKSSITEAHGVLAGEDDRILKSEETSPTARMTLHEAITKVLREFGRPMMSGEVRKAVNDRGLYTRRDGEPVRTTQVAARVRNYADRFCILHDGRISLVDKT